MPQGDLIFSSLRSGSRPVPKNTDTLSSVKSDVVSIDSNLRRYGTHTESVETGSGKNVTIRNNTLTIGVSSEVSRSAFHGPRMKLSTTGLKPPSSKVARSQNIEVINDKKNESNEQDLYNKTTKSSVELELTFHESRFSTDQVMLDITAIKGAREGDLAELKTYKKTPGSKDKKVYFIIKDFDSETKRRAKSSQVSVLSGQLQQVLDLPSRSKVWVKLKDKESLTVDLIELHVKDCHVNRGDMWKFSTTLQDTCVFLGQKVSLIEAVRATVKGIYRNGKKVFSGYINDNTKIVYRSESAKILFLIQITDEMWHFEEKGEETFHKVVNSLFPEIFKKWKSIGTHHSISIMFCASVDRSESSFNEVTSGERLKSTDDYYRVVVDQVNIVHWVEIMKTLRKEFLRIAQDLRNVKLNDDVSVIRGSLPSVIKSNLLETINVATSLITDPFKQNDLRHTTTHAIIVTAGSGLYDVDYDLLKITTKKLMSLEITMDLICLTRPPLHIVPLLRYRDYKNELHYCTPTWLSISFWNDSSRGNVEWRPRCKIYDVLMMGLTETELKDEIALQSLNMNDKCKSVSEFMEDYDSGVFGSQNKKINVSGTIVPESKGDKAQNNNWRKNNVSKENDSTNVMESIKWMNPTSTDAILQPTFKEEVFAQLSSTSSAETENNHAKNDYASTAKDSLALNTLKRLRDNKSGVTQRLFSKLFPELSIKKSTESLNSPQDSLTGTPTITSTTTEPLPISKTHSRLSFKETNLSNRNKKGDSEDYSVSSSESVNANVQERRPLLSDTSQNSSRANNSTKKKMKGDSWIEIDNPSVPVDSAVASYLIPNRWRDVFPKYVAKKYTKWRSFTTPAELPLTTSLFPTPYDFENQFMLRNHTVSLTIEQEGYQQSVFDLLQNMLYVRLLAGFQFCLGKDVKKVEMILNKDTSGSRVTNIVTADNYTDVTIYMRIDDEIHRIVCSDQTVYVQRYVKHEDLKLLQNFAKYTPNVKTRYETEYRELDSDPIKAQRESYNWNHMDQVLAGYGDNVIDSTAQKKFRCKFVILPAEIPPNTFQSTINGRKETLTAEEIRLEGLRKIISSISRSRLRTESEKKDKKNHKEEILPEVLFYTGYLFDFIEEHNDFLKNSGTEVKNSIFMEDAETLSKDADLSKIAFELQYGLDPIKLVNRKWHFKRHDNCFIGLELVNWLIEHFSDIHTREEAVIYGQGLMNKGLFHHVESRHGFLDGHYFYQLKPEFTTENKPLYKTSTKHSNESNLQRKISTSNKSESTKSMDPIVATESNQISEDQINIPEEHNVTVMLSNAVTINLDPNKKSYKLETCVAHYDRVHNPDHCFHIRLEWLTATPKLIDDLISNWSRLVERYGMKLVEIPWDELCNIPKINPFHSFMNIRLAINPWEEEEFKDESIFKEQKFFYHIYLLEKSGFLLDNRASKFFQSEKSSNYQIVYSWGKPMFKYAQYIHYSGSCMAEIRENGDLFLAPNNLHISRVNIGSIIGKSNSYPKFTLDARKIMLDFKKTCETYESLRVIFLEAKEKHLENAADFEEYSPFQSFNLYM
ncbi:vacuolar membrane-associated protein IML1 [Kluyveromyces marxianus DMKU3-1042]|uniref:Vacuolar membrane-associated protein IML1 n=1 Tax=Kluyveromyces marxianus (strain DMKU3-1042 / BCC 29191 / NBRC 104275) TaxID=1003335 RepID=W0TCI1_KLUMD|nr:vacuolar membrane-associated protein IML1 [Kluyveromyces marxianus DMKU3-1042]BAO40516.1 vacuolar membrane-associated protein IML1 [Kluyveromyces marxianus DMKU3-1042]